MITLKKINLENISNIMSLKVTKEQVNFVQDNPRCIAEVYAIEKAGGILVPFGLYAYNVLVGFVMIGYGEIPSKENIEAAKDSYSIHNLMIDEKYQNRGYGLDAMNAAVSYIKTLPFGKASHIYISYEYTNRKVRDMFRQLGFKENGEVVDDFVIATTKI